jgi:hypothetical protein
MYVQKYVHTCLTTRVHTYVPTYTDTFIRTHTMFIYRPTHVCKHEHLSRKILDHRGGADMHKESSLFVHLIEPRMRWRVFFFKVCVCVCVSVFSQRKQSPAAPRIGLVFFQTCTRGMDVHVLMNVSMNSNCILAHTTKLKKKTVVVTSRSCTGGKDHFCAIFK